MPKLTSQRKLSNLAKQVEVGTQDMIKRVALDIDSALVLTTPVDTGRARSNWQVSIGKTAAGTIDQPASPSETIGNAKSELAKLRDSDSSVHITNNLPYIQRLNEGWSPQQPAGFVDQAIATVVGAIHKQRILSK
jgi:hypothetical protein